LLGSDFERAFPKHAAERGAKRFNSWTQIVAMLFSGWEWQMFAHSSLNASDRELSGF
jgi:hypothetical protein